MLSAPSAKATNYTHALCIASGLGRWSTEHVQILIEELIMHRLAMYKGNVIEHKHAYKSPIYKNQCIFYKVLPCIAMVVSSMHICMLIWIR